MRQPLRIFLQLTRTSCATAEERSTDLESECGCDLPSWVQSQRAWHKIRFVTKCVVLAVRSILYSSNAEGSLCRVGLVMSDNKGSCQPRLCVLGGLRPLTSMVCARWLAARMACTSCLVA